MTDKKEQNKGVHPVVAGIAGAVVGAGVAVAATVVLKDEKTQDKVKKVFNDVRKQTMEYMDELHKNGNIPGKKIEEKLDAVKEEAKKLTSSVKKESNRKTSTVKDKKTAAKA